MGSRPRPGLERLLVSDYGRKRRLFGASRVGSLFLIDERDDGDDLATGSAIVGVPGRLLTRSYGGNDTGLKRWVRALANVNMDGGSQAGCRAIFDNPDLALDVGGITTDTQEDFALKFSMRIKAHTMQLEFNNLGLYGFELRNAAVDVATDRPEETTRSIK